MPVWKDENGNFISSDGRNHGDNISYANSWEDRQVKGNIVGDGDIIDGFLDGAGGLADKAIGKASKVAGAAAGVGIGIILLIIGFVVAVLPGLILGLILKMGIVGRIIHTIVFTAVMTLFFLIVLTAAGLGAEMLEIPEENAINALIPVLMLALIPSVLLGIFWFWLKLYFSLRPFKNILFDYICLVAVCLGIFIIGCIILFVAFLFILNTQPQWIQVMSFCFPILITFLFWLHQMKEFEPLSKKEMELVIQSAKAGNGKAQFALANVYFYGKGNVEMNELEAVKWYKLSAENGYAEAQYQMGLFYKSSLSKYEEFGITHDMNKAYELMEKAAAQGNKDAIKELSEWVWE